MKITRRTFLIGGSLAILALMSGIIGLPKLKRNARELLKSKHIQGMAGGPALEPAILGTITAVAGALFGRTLSSEDHDDLAKRFDFAVTEDSGWHDEFRWLASYVNDLSIESGGSGFIDTPTDNKNHIIEIITDKGSPRESRLLALISETERSRRRMLKSTLPYIANVYIRSGVPWRARGYTSWPGVPGDPREYTLPGPETAC